MYSPVAWNNPRYSSSWSKRLNFNLLLQTCYYSSKGSVIVAVDVAVDVAVVIPIPIPIAIPIAIAFRLLYFKKDQIDKHPCHTIIIYTLDALNYLATISNPYL